MDDVDSATQVLETLGRALHPPPVALAVAFSGGLDSTVLLAALTRLASDRGWPAPRALHVDHGLHPDSGRWREHCARVCAGLAVPFAALRVDARGAPGESPEAAARAARYAALAGVLTPAEALCTAHHADDQAETVLLNLLRGSGPQGLAAMRERRALGSGWLLRPLLGLRRATLHACAREWGLDWVEDPSNASARHPRNRLRHEVMPLLERIAPGVVGTLARSAALQREAAESLASRACEDLEVCRGERPGVLARGALRALPSARRRAALRTWLSATGVPLPPEATLREAERQLVASSPEAHPRLVWRGGELRAWRDRVYALRAPPPPPPAGGLAWSPETPLELPGGRLQAVPALGSGLRAGGALQVCFRRGGERCRPAERARSQTLRRLLQEHRVPPWERSGLPLLHRDGELVAVADLWVCAGHAAGPGEPGWLVRWHRR